MGDSDEEYDRRRARDKFRRERSDYQERRDDRGRRDDWSERDRGNRREYRDYDPRNRREREDRGGYGNNFDGGYGGGGGSGGMMGGPPSGWGMQGQQNHQREMDTGATQPPMMTFKQFLSSQDDGIDDQEAVKKYNEYKLEFKRQQINEFFLNHKDEEWFKLKHHPEESAKRKGELQVALNRRLDVFMELYEKGWVDAISIDQENSEQIIRFLDAVVVKLEGGSDFDLKVLDEPYEEEKPKETTIFRSLIQINLKEEKNGNEEEKESKINDEEEVAKPKKKRKRSQSSQSGENDSTAESESDEESVPPASKLEENNDFDKETLDEPDDEEKVKESVTSHSPKLKKKKITENEEEKVTEDGEEKIKKKRTHSQSSQSGEESSAESEADAASEPIDGEKEGNGEKEEEAEKEEDAEKEEECEAVMEEEEGEEEESSKEPKPRPLHKTHSIFLRYLAPSITKQEVEALCKRFPGFLRVAIADPQPERRFARRAWVTFERSVNIKEMCWNLNGIRLRDNELGAIVNRDLSRRIRSVNGISSHKQVVRADIKLGARIIQNLDKQKKLWDAGECLEELDEREFLMTSKNPLLKNITDYLIEEASAEEDELLGMGDREDKEGEEGCTLERDDSLIKVLDRLLLYLRVVHSVDYYNSSEYPSEDEMPNRCGIMHARGSPPCSKVTQHEINDYIASFEVKSQTFLTNPIKIEEEDCNKLGKKDPEVEVEKFILANTQELAKDKWLCPLSGKKFKGPEFVRKHIYNKHGEKVEEVRKEVEYFNNYLTDPKRAQLPEHPANRPPLGRNEMHGNMGHPFHGGPFPPPMPPYGFGPRGPGPNFPGFGGGQNYGRGGGMYRDGGFGKRNYQRRSPRSDPRKLITYRDLDAPNDMDLF